MLNSLGNKEKMAKNIRRYLDVKGMTMKDLAANLDVPYTTVVDWCKAATYPRIDKIERMANLFGCSKMDLVEDPDELRDEMMERAFSDRPEMRQLFKATYKLTKEDVEQWVRTITAYYADDD